MNEKSSKVTESLQENDFVVAFASKFRSIKSHAMWDTTRSGTCISSVVCCATYKEKPGVAAGTFDGGWGMCVEGWNVGVGENWDLEANGDVQR